MLFDIYSQSGLLQIKKILELPYGHWERKEKSHDHSHWNLKVKKLGATFLVCAEVLYNN